MRVAALAPLAAMLVSIANAAPVPNADPLLSLCIFGKPRQIAFNHVF